MKIIVSVWLLAIVSIFLIKSADSKAALPLKNLLKSEELNSPAQDTEVLLNYRLPNHTYPEHYDVKITTDVHLGERAFQGEVVIDIVVVSTTNHIVLHARQLNISQVNIENPYTGQTKELSHEYELEREFLTLKHKSGKRFKAGSKWKLIISYSGELRTDKQGFYFIKYADENGQDRYVASTQFESTDARHAFPCYDEPGKRANFTITINHGANLTAISNMPVNEQHSSPGNTVFLTTARIPPYIVAFIVCDFEYTEVIFGGIRQRVYSRSSGKHDQQFSLVNGMLYINYLSEYYGIDYMSPKLDQVALTEFNSGGMENWGLTTYPERNLLYNRTTFTTSSQTNIAKIVAHEVAHQWFGDYVTIQWWNNLWLKEGFVTLFSYKAVENVYPEWNVWQDFHVIDYQRALSASDGVNSRPITAYVETPAEIGKIYDEISYFKSASVLLMWQQALGEEVFRSGLQNFLKNNQYSAATEEDLLIELDKSAEMEELDLPASVSEMMKTWSHQGGYPILTVTRNYDEGSFTIRQETFLKNETLKDIKTWYIPINFAVASNADFRDTKASHYLPNSNEEKIDAQLASADWIILNKRSEYFYRIKYDEENYKLITKALVEQPFKIHSRNRAQLLDDAVDLTFSNRLKHEVLLEMLTYLKKEDQYAPWLTASNVINEYRKFKDFEDFHYFVRDLVGPIFNKLGVNEIAGEHHYDKYTRINVIQIAGRAGLKECLAESHKKLKAHLLENVTIEPNLELPIFIAGLIQADDEVFHAAYQKLMDSPVKGERVLLIYYLGFVQNEKHIKKFISSSIDMSKKLRSDERKSILGGVYGKSEKSLLACIEFLRQNWDAYGNLKVDDKDKNPLDKDIHKMASYVLNEKVEKELLALVKEVRESNHVSKTLESDVKTKIAKNYEWLEQHGDPILSWMSEYRLR